MFIRITNKVIIDVKYMYEYMKYIFELIIYMFENIIYNL